jgi:phosphoenolpyruvate phosphomutase
MVDADAQLDGEDKDFVSTSKPYSREIYLSSDRGIELKNVSSSMKGKEINGEFIGLWKVNKKGALIVKSTLEKLSSHPNFKKMNCGDLFNEIVKEHKIAVKYIRGSWIDIDNLKDLLKAGEF